MQSDICDKGIGIQAKEGYANKRVFYSSRKILTPVLAAIVIFGFVSIHIETDF